jgi:uncharacterized protein with PQ loop repeat
MNQIIQKKKKKKLTLLIFHIISNTMLCAILTNSFLILQVTKHIVPTNDMPNEPIYILNTTEQAYYLMYNNYM